MDDTSIRKHSRSEVMRGRRRMLRWLMPGLLVPGCVLDTEDRCGPNQVLWTNDQRCICAEGTAFTATGCVPCGENEVGTAAGCVCADGYARASATEACTQCGENASATPTGCVCDAGFSRSSPGESCMAIASGGSGSPCTSEPDCTNPDYPYCQIGITGDGYCTSAGCATDADCADGFSCVTSSSPSVCRLPPEGAGVPCATPTECAGTEALFCDTFVSHTCLVQDCSLAPNDCFPGMECCNVGAGIPLICIPAGSCQT